MRRAVIYPEVAERYGVAKAGPHLKNVDYAYCRRCEHYYTRNTEELLRCPICGTLLKHRWGKARNPSRVDPERYGVVEVA